MVGLVSKVGAGRCSSGGRSVGVHVAISVVVSNFTSTPPCIPQAIELHVNIVYAYLLPGLPGNSRGPLGTLMPSLVLVFLLRAPSLGRRSATVLRVADAGIEGFRKPPSPSGFVAVR